MANAWKCMMVANKHSATTIDYIKYLYEQV